MHDGEADDAAEDADLGYGAHGDGVVVGGDFDAGDDHEADKAHAEGEAEDDLEAVLVGGDAAVVGEGGEEAGGDDL